MGQPQHSNEKPPSPTDTEHDETEIVRAKFVIGCDGAHSWTRKELGIELEGEQTGSCVSLSFDYSNTYAGI